MGGLLAILLTAQKLSRTHDVALKTNMCRVSTSIERPYYLDQGNFI